MSKTQSCKESSSNAGEHLYGTVPRVDHWFLLEYRDHWEKDSLEKSSVSRDVKNEMHNLLESFKNSRFQLIKSDNSGDNDICFYYINSTEFQPKAYKFVLNNYEDIMQLNLADLIERGDINDSVTDEVLVLVCTHGSYDSCCGKYGVQVYNEIQNNSKIKVWRTTHVGSHRFSANLVMLPQGIYYGRVNTENVGEIINSHLNNEIYLDCFRGRCCYSQPSQVSDFFLRRELKKYGIFDIRREFEKDRDIYIAVEFKIENEDLGYSINSVVFNDAISIKASCRDDKPTPIPQFYFYSLIPYTPKETKEG
ncbi:MAG: sucrase ferredoxin [Thermodesulfobacteriota bacterium]